MTRDRWALELEARARAHWTAARTDELLRGKDVAVRPGDAAVLLRALGILNADASMPAATVRKYFQINHMIGTLRRSVDDLRARHATVRIVDAGCGRSYLTMLLAWCGAHAWSHRVEVIGVDRNPDVIAEGARRAALAGLDDRVRFVVGAVDQLAVADLGAIHAVIALHACDTASCDAIALGVGLGAELIAVAPCCQAELARGWAALAADADAEGAFAAVWRTPHLRRELAAHTTDLLRTLLLRAAGYDVTATEFIPAEHSRKNTLLRATRAAAAPDADAARQYHALVEATGGVGIALAARLGGTIDA